MTNPNPWPWFLCGATLAAIGCQPDLPAGWEDAELVEDFSQASCSGSPYEDDLALVSAQPAKGGADVDYRHALFRCAQDVEAYLRHEKGALDVLVQPVDMDPSSVAGCDCLYDISMNLPSASGEQRITVYHRGDNMNVDNDPMKEGEALITVP